MRISDWSSDVCSSDLGKAAAYPELFYGQLSLEQLGRPVPRPRPVTAIPISPGERTAFYAKDLVQAIRLLGQMGNRDDQTRSERRRVGEESGGTGRHRGAPAH